MDSWLISVDKRKPDSTVSERYELAGINAAVEKIVKGETVSPPVYDPATRKRVEGITGQPVQLDAGVLIVEGVIALADTSLRNQSHISIFVDIADILRIKRLLDFYNRVKKVERAAYKNIILEREKEETLFVKRSMYNADLIFNW